MNLRSTRTREVLENTIIIRPQIFILQTSSYQIWWNLLMHLQYPRGTFFILVEFNPTNASLAVREIQIPGLGLTKPVLKMVNIKVYACHQEFIKAVVVFTPTLLGTNPFRDAKCSRLKPRPRFNTGMALSATFSKSPSLSTGPCICWGPWLSKPSKWGPNKF